MIKCELSLFLCAALLSSAVPVRAQEEAAFYADAGDNLTPVGCCVGRELVAADLNVGGGIEADLDCHEGLTNPEYDKDKK